MFLGAKVRIKIYIASDLSVFLSTFNILCAFQPALKPLFCHKTKKNSKSISIINKISNKIRIFVPSM